MGKHDSIIEDLCTGIINPKVKENVRYYLAHEIDPIFFKIHAAKNYHAPDERGEGGLILHTKRVKLVTVWLCEANKIKGRWRDIMIAAAVVHDSRKHYITDTPTIRDEGVYRYNEDHADAIKDSSLLPEIIRIAKMHMGPWYREDRWKKSCEYGKLLYYADYIASRFEFNLKV